MKKGTIKLLLISVFVLILLIIFVKSYSSLSSLNEEVINKESNINVQLNKKREQVESICEALKKYIVDEELFNNIEEANIKLKNSMNKDIKERNTANEELSKLINQLFERKNEEMLKDEEVISTIEELLKTEKRLDTARNNYNEAVENYNSKVKSFPASIIASFRGFKTKDVFNAIEINNILEKEE